MEFDFDKKEKKKAYACIIRSRILGEDIIINRDKNKMESLKREYPDLVIYTASEINNLEKFKGDHDAIRRIHHAKKMFNGKIYKRPGDK